MDNVMKNGKVVVEKNGMVTRIAYENDGSSYAGVMGSSPLVFPKFKKEKKKKEENGEEKKKVSKKVKNEAEGEKKKEQKNTAPKKEKEKAVVHFAASKEDMNARHKAANMNMNAFGFSGIKVHLKEEDAPVPRKAAVRVMKAEGGLDHPEAA